MLKNNVISNFLCYLYWRMLRINFFIFGDEDEESAAFTRWRIKAGLSLILALPWIVFAASRIEGLFYWVFLSVIIVINGLLIELSVKYSYIIFLNSFEGYSKQQKTARDLVLIMFVIIDVLYFGTTVYELKNNAKQPDSIVYGN